MNMSGPVYEKRDQVLEIAARHGACNVRVFGSVARGEASPDWGERATIQKLVVTLSATSERAT